MANNCASSCKTKDHRTYGECLRSQGLSTAAGETTRASGPTRPNDALTAKATACTCPAGTPLAGPGVLHEVGCGQRE